MIKIALVGDICSGKTYISKLFKEKFPLALSNAKKKLNLK